jgi:hypothetical protein
MSNQARPSDYARYQQAYALMQQNEHLTFSEACDRIAALHDIKPDSVRRQVNRARKAMDAPVFVSYEAVTFPSEETRFKTPVFDGYWELELDRCIVVGDVHVPTTDWQFAARVAQVARAHDVDTLCIIGDLFNFDAMSDYKSLVPGIPLYRELAAGREMIAEWLRTFDQIYMVVGNHEHRLMKKTDLALGYEELRSLITTSDRFKMSPYSHMVVVSGGQTWRLTHQRNYSKNKQKVAQLLAQKYQCNVITHHQHHVSIGMDDFGRYAVVDNGGLHASESMAYVQLVDSTSPNMTQSFVLLQDGTAHLLTPYPAMTDWRQWVGEQEKKLVKPDFGEQAA